MTRAQFRERIRNSLAKPTLQIALDDNAKRRVNGRINALASLPDWRERRQQAHAIRADVIEHLEEYLEQFIHKVKGNGIIVHRAKDAVEAIRIVLEIVNDSSRRAQREKEEILVAKSK